MCVVRSRTPARLISISENSTDVAEEGALVFSAADGVGAVCLRGHYATTRRTGGGAIWGDETTFLPDNGQHGRAVIVLPAIHAHQQRLDAVVHQAAQRPEQVGVMCRPGAVAILRYNQQIDVTVLTGIPTGVRAI